MYNTIYIDESLVARRRGIREWILRYMCVCIYYMKYDTLRGEHGEVFGGVWGFQVVTLDVTT